VIALDKTGTLPEGRPELTDLETAQGHARDEVLALIASVEAASEHPVAQAIVNAAKAQGLPVAAHETFESLTGRGVRGTVNGQDVAIGSAGLMAELGISTEPFAARAEALAKLGRTAFFAAIDGQLAGLFAVADPIMPSTPHAI